MKTRYGALIVSLDFELHWGVRDLTPPDGPYRQTFLGTWEAVPRMLALFEEYDVAATWATVGFLFAKSKREVEEFSPSVKPLYTNPLLYPYDEPIGENETDDPLHFAPSLIEAIRRTPRQELATHTFSHYFCLEPGQNRKMFKADLDSAVSIASKNGVRLRSIVFPKNQHNPDYDDLLVDAGIMCYRGNQRARIYRPTGVAGQTMLRRTAKLFDSYLNLAGLHTVSWDVIRQDSELCNIPASFFVRPIPTGFFMGKPYSLRWKRLGLLHLRRIVEAIRRAAVSKEVLHICWHPHDFGIYTDQNIDFLRKVLETFSRYRDSHGMRSMSMADAAAVVRGSYD